MNRRFSRFPLALWAALQRAPLLVIVGVVAFQTGFSLDNRALWFSDEVRYAAAFQSLVSDGNWLVLSLNGVAYPDKPPVYFWLLAALHHVFNLEAPKVLFLGSAVTGVLMLWAADVLNRTLGARPEVRLTASLLLLSLLPMMGLFQYVRMDLLFGALMLLSMAAFYRHYLRGGARLYAYLGFVLAGVAILVKGPLGVLLPLMTLLAYLAWSGRISAFFSRASGIGFVLCLATVSLWLGAIIWVEGADYLIGRVFLEQVVDRATDAFHHKEPFHYYLRVLPLALLPWLGLLAALPIRRAAAAGYWRGVWASRRHPSGTAFAAVGAGAMFVALSAFDSKVAVYVLPILPLLMLLLAELLWSGQAASERGMVGVAVLLGLLAIGLTSLGFGDDHGLSKAGTLGGGAVLAALAVWLALRRRGRLEALLPVLVAGLSFWMVVQSVLTLPSLDARLSTRDHALLLHEHIQKGYQPVAFNTYSGIYTFYAGANLIETADPQALAALLEAGGPLVLAIRTRDWDAQPQLAAQMRILDQREIVGAGGQYLVAVRDAVPIAP
jgi:4-amino-4-deoxy-L-arabinose transferase-like glycosyltransferase